MKKICLLCIVLLLLAGTVFGQVAPDLGKTSLGIQYSSNGLGFTPSSGSGSDISLNVSSLLFEFFWQPSSGLGLVAGTSIGVPISIKQGDIEGIEIYDGLRLSVSTMLGLGGYIIDTESFDLVLGIGPSITAILLSSSGLDLFGSYTIGGQILAKADFQLSPNFGLYAKASLDLAFVNVLPPLFGGYKYKSSLAFSPSIGVFFQ